MDPKIEKPKKPETVERALHAKLGWPLARAKSFLAKCKPETLGELEAALKGPAVDQALQRVLDRLADAEAPKPTPSPPVEPPKK